MQKSLWMMLLIGCILAGCLRKIPIEQGNVFTPDMVSQVHLGMTESEVKNILGTPVLMNTFNTHRVDYVYTFKLARAPMIKKYITFIFKDGRLKEMNRNLYSQYIQ